jgi:hypothetical protein
VGDVKSSAASKAVKSDWELRVLGAGPGLGLRKALDKGLRRRVRLVAHKRERRWLGEGVKLRGDTACKLLLYCQKGEGRV